MGNKKYTLSELRQLANNLLLGNSKVVHLKQMKQIFYKYGYQVETVGNKFVLTKIFK